MAMVAVGYWTGGDDAVATVVAVEEAGDVA